MRSKLNKQTKKVRFVVFLAYHGAKFHGWAIQPNGIVSVQEEVQKVLTKLFNEPIKIIASGRTDAGVHAREQVFHFDGSNTISCSQTKKVLNSYNFHHSWVAKKVTIKPDSFHARYSVKSKVYLYRIETNNIFNPIEYETTWQYNHSLDLKKMLQLSKYFIGTHNFLSFSTSTSPDSIKTISNITIRQKNTQVYIYVRGSGFLRSMVRMLVGALVKYSSGKIGLNECLGFLNNPQKGKAVFKAPASGLYLWKVEYQ
ncbi:tRNA pseudouridine(38-40) synthase TruA [[Mycoplasma] testudinis]|uniref:tRNA pseudouridine(38-40) synthase TruA n=1 Tax=[Mycoplasma] testudinis TaxID=33924 RepID=UPI0006962DDC|nr:tRNA pseudouridine(38-40) synthase TruA [[Mycoplasma] testudinis]